MNYPGLILGHLLAFAYDVASVYWWVAYDVKTFNYNPADDSFGAVFHRQRGTWRVLVSLAVYLACALGAADWRGRWPHLGPAYWFTLVALAALGVGYWLRTFNPLLNMRRNLPYVKRFYISFAENAASFPDRFLNRRALARYPYPEQLEDAKAWAAEENHKLLNIILWVSLVTYVLLTVHSTVV